ncbi:hypothetical protein G6F40_016221 [Rhizopus arrhizus]|nr:hypothetical protein G6F40_016221 [Rhizopus arrhizus]
MPNPLLPGLQLQPLPYHDRLPLRDPAALEMVVIHCTELPDLAMAREYGERVLYDSGAGNRGHFYIARDGRVVQYVAPERVAHHPPPGDGRAVHRGAAGGTGTVAAGAGGALPVAAADCRARPAGSGAGGGQRRSNAAGGAQA